MIEKEKHNSSYIIKTLIAGGISGCVGSIRGISAAIGEIYANRGIVGLFQGHSATILRIFPYAAVKFMVFEQYKTVILRFISFLALWLVYHSIFIDILGVTSVIMTYPLDTLRARMAYEVSNHSGLSGTANKIYNEAPKHTLRILNFYRGVIPTILGMIPYAGVSFWAHQNLMLFCRDYLTKYTLIDPKIKSKKGIKWWVELTCGGLAGLAAQTTSYPFEVIRRRIQISGAEVNSLNTSIVNTIINIYNTQGLKGFYVGLSVGYIKIAPLVSISFFVYSRMKIWLNVN